VNERNPPRRAATRLAPALLPLALLFIALLPAGAQADPIVLTGGEIVVDRTTQVARVNLVGNNFSVSYLTDLQSSLGFSAGSFGTNTVFCGCDGFGTATFDGFTTQNFTGGGVYDTATISGRIFFFTAGFPERPSLFSLDYVGAGFLAVDTPTFTRFVITGGAPSLVPEPATVVLLGSGLAGLAAGVRRRRKGKVEVAGSSPG
jgi:hypothetical protein